MSHQLRLTGPDSWALDCLHEPGGEWATFDEVRLIDTDGCWLQSWWEAVDTDMCSPDDWPELTIPVDVEGDGHPGGEPLLIPRVTP